MNPAITSSPDLQPASQLRGLRPLPLLATVNLFNYLDRQVVYTMAEAIGKTFELPKYKLGWLTWVNLVVFALASLISGPIADRIGPRKVIFTGVFLWSIATIGSALAQTFPQLLFFRAMVGIGEGAYGPSAMVLLCASARPEERGRVLGIYNAGMAVGGSLGLFLGSTLAEPLGWRNVFWIAGAPSLALALLSGFVASPSRLPRPKVLPARSYIFSTTYIVTVLGGILVTFAGAGLLFWARSLIIHERGFSVFWGSLLIGSIGLFCGIGGVIVGGLLGDKAAKTDRGGHAKVIGLSLLLAFPLGLGTLLVEQKAAFALLTLLTVFLLCMYNGPIGVLIDELAPPQYAATLQAVFLFCVHVVGDAPAATVVGYIAGYTSVGRALLVTVFAYGIAGLLLLWTMRRLQKGKFAGSHG